MKNWIKDNFLGILITLMVLLLVGYLIYSVVTQSEKYSAEYKEQQFQTELKHKYELLKLKQAEIDLICSAVEKMRNANIVINFYTDADIKEYKGRLPVNVKFGE